MATNILDPFSLSIREIATGLQVIQGRNETMHDVFPYPEPLQRGFERLTWLYQQRKTYPPQSIMELLRLCTQPFKNWPAYEHVLPTEWAATEQLLSWGMPTQFCQELTCDNANVADELMQNEYFVNMLNECRVLNAQSDYVRFRQLFIEHVIIETVALLEKLAQFSSSRIRDLIRHAFEPIPETLSVNGSLDLCGNCSYVRRPVEGKFICEQEVCRVHFPNIQSRSIPYTTTLLRLKRPFRRYISFPGLAELNLARKLQKSGLEVQLWPHFDRYDLHVTFPNGTDWAIDVKDWANPYSLGSSLQEVSFSSEFSAFFYVVPNYRLTYRPDYTRAVESKCSHLNKVVRVVSERQLMKAVKKQLIGL